jgi:hypothetical protein
MSNSKTKKGAVKTKADLELIAGKESLLIEKEKRYQTELKKNRRPQVEKLTALKETKKKAAPKAKAKK